MHDNTRIEEYLYVVVGNGPTLLGCDILSKIRFDWSTVYCVADTSTKLQALKPQYSELSSDKFVKFLGFIANIYVKEDATPKFCKPRNVAFA